LRVLAWVPYADVLPELPATLPVDVYDGVAEPPKSIEDVEFYVAPYTFNRDTLRLMAQMPQLRMVQTLTAGYDHVLPFLPAGVALHNAGGLHDTSTAELALTLTLAALRGIPDFVRGQDLGQWRHARHDSLADRTVLILGYGGIGSAVERRLAGFEATVLRVAAHARDGVHTLADLPELLPRTGVVVICVPLTDQTRGLVNAEFLARLPDGALLVNVARGGVVDTEALVAELHRGRLRAALDVTDPEPPPPHHPLWTAPGVLLSPHVGGNSSAFEPRARRLILEQLNRYAAGEPLRYQVTP
jgi:phosphoglycerate dehydrogenase-like enzyme